jgi:hypothetical protein
MARTMEYLVGKAEITPSCIMKAAAYEAQLMVLA